MGVGEGVGVGIVVGRGDLAVPASSRRETAMGVAGGGGVSVGVWEGVSTSARTRALMSGVGVGAVVGPHAVMRAMTTRTSHRSTFMPPFSHITDTMRSQNGCAKPPGMARLK